MFIIPSLILNIVIHTFSFCKSKTYGYNQVLQNTSLHEINAISSIIKFHKNDCKESNFSLVRFYVTSDDVQLFFSKDFRSSNICLIHAHVLPDIIILFRFLPLSLMGIVMVKFLIDITRCYFD
jgi:hypothetical protein